METELSCPTCGFRVPTAGGQCTVCQFPSAVDVPRAQPDEEEYEAIEVTDDEPGPLPAPAKQLPGVLPAPLADPLRAVWWFYLALLFPAAALVGYEVASASEASNQMQAEKNWLAPVLFCSGFLFVFGVWLTLPRRQVDIVYLRAFGNDTATAGIRTDLNVAFGRGIRVSGIRDPRRRWPFFLRFMNTALFALRYATPKYLNLEAGDNWKARLWRTLGQARGVVVDVSVLTPHVAEEVRLCYRVMGRNGYCSSGIRRGRGNGTRSSPACWTCRPTRL